MSSYSGNHYDCDLSHSIGRLETPSPTVTVISGNSSATLSCELYGYLTENSPSILWNFGGDELRNDSVFTITTEDGNHMIQNGGDFPQPSVRSILTIDFPNKTHDGAYFCSAGSSLSRIDLQVLEGESQVSVCTIR